MPWLAVQRAASEVLNRPDIAVPAKRQYEEVEVPLPLYRYHDVGTDDCEGELFAKVDQVHGRFIEYTLHRTKYWGDEEPTWQLKVSLVSPTPHPDEESDYLLGRGEHELSAEEFEEKRAEFQAWAIQHGFVKP